MVVGVGRRVEKKPGESDSSFRKITGGLLVGRAELEAGKPGERQWSAGSRNWLDVDVGSRTKKVPGSPSLLSLSIHSGVWM